MPFTLSSKYVILTVVLCAIYVHREVAEDVRTERYYWT